MEAYDVGIIAHREPVCIMRHCLAFLWPAQHDGGTLSISAALRRLELQHSQVLDTLAALFAAILQSLLSGTQLSHEQRDNRPAISSL